MSAVWELDLPREQKFVLMAIADHANDDGYAWPSASRLAWKCGYKQRRQVMAIVQRLIELGLLLPIEPAAGRRPPSYLVRPHFGTPLEPFNAADWRTDRGAKTAPQENGATANAMSEKAKTVAESARGAVIAPRDRRGATVAALGCNQRHVGVQSSQHESYNRHKNPALGPPAQSPGTGAGGSDLIAFDNAARRLGEEFRRRDESVDEYRQRIERAEGRRLDAELERRRAERAAQASVPGNAA